MISTLNLLFLFQVLHSTGTGDILFIDDFSSGTLESNWIIYGDPQPFIMENLGNPAPCFNNNGDAMYGSGAVSREVFSIENGLVLESDMYISCSERGAWVSGVIGFSESGFRGTNSPDTRTLATLSFLYCGEMDWQKPHLQCVLLFHCQQDDETIFTRELLHMNQYLDDWHRFRLELTEDRRVHFFINDSLLISTSSCIPDSIETVRVFLGDRSSDWGIALHDNLIVYREN
ncbi:MAG: hypothetical protein KAW14_06385 [Candidatus Aegiribacteria sp.]|nr:hypothetical protein [Candidatus Aegiribacteria sp.]